MAASRPFRAQGFFVFLIRWWRSPRLPYPAMRDYQPTTLRVGMRELLRLNEQSIGCGVLLGAPLAGDGIHQVDGDKDEEAPVEEHGLAAGDFTVPAGFFDELLVGSRLHFQYHGVSRG